MKRNRAELTMAKSSNETTTKPQRRTRGGQNKAPARSKPAATQPGFVAGGVAVKKEPQSCSPVSAEEVAAWSQEVVGWDVVALSELTGACGVWWCGGVEEEKLLGWFPFGDEHFPCFEGRGFEDEVFHDIWELQHIHEIPS